MKKQTVGLESVAPAVERTFSDMAFIDVTELTEHSAKIDSSHIIHIYFHEPMEGEIALVLPSECKRMIVENIYGCDWRDLHATEIDDCLLEILNVLAGNFLDEYWGRDVKHDISLPELRFDENEIDAGSGFTDFYFDAEGVPFKVSIRFKSL